MTPDRLPGNFQWRLKKATDADIEQAIAKLGCLMNFRRQEALRDKLKRYVRKPDRDLFIAVKSDMVLGFTCLMEEAESPIHLPLSTKELLRGFACATGLFVHSDFRKRGIGESLVRSWEEWARERQRSGIWLVTHRMARWYRQFFAFEAVGRIRVKDVEKTVMARNLFSGRMKNRPDFFTRRETVDGGIH